MRRAAPALLLLWACGSNTLPQSFAGLVQVSGPSPFTACSGPAGLGGVLYPDAEVEPCLAADPADPNHLVAVWQQDRWSNGGARGIGTAFSLDAGHGWTRVTVPFSRCAGGSFDRASDPWVSIGPSGVVHQIAYGFDLPTGPGPVRRAMLASRSGDGGRSWSAPAALQLDTDPDFLIDKETITADAHDPRLVYAVWDRLTGASVNNNPLGTGPAWFARSTDGGLSWEPARAIWDPGVDAQTLSNQVVVLPDGTLLDFLAELTQNSSSTPHSKLVVLRSADHGASWPTRVPIADSLYIGSVDPKNGKPIRSGSGVPSIAVDASGGAVWVAWEDARFSGFARDGIAAARSIDGGLNWSAPIQVNQATGAQAFTPVVSAAAGRVSVAYIDLRKDDPGDSDHLLAAHWLATSGDDGASWHEAQLSPPFDLRGAPVAGGYFLGDYLGLAAVPGAFLPLLVVARNGDPANPTDVFFRPADAAPLPAPAVAAVVPTPLRGGRERWRLWTLFR